MNERRITSLGELMAALEPYRRPVGWIFRGHGSSSYGLVPRVGREPYLGVDERMMLEAWKRRAIALGQVQASDDWEWLAVAQHHGLATRLLDWTRNPLAAAFFAVAGEQEGDAHVYALFSRRQVRFEEEDPLQVEGVVSYRPRAVAQRISRQDAVFTVHGPPHVPLDEALRPDQRLERLVIDGGYRRELLFELHQLGITRLTLFPDLDGLAAYVNWVIENRDYWVDEGEELTDVPLA